MSGFAGHTQEGRFGPYFGPGPRIVGKKRMKRTKTTSVICLVNCFLQMGHGLAITYVHGLNPRLNRSMAGAGYKFIVSSGM